jgi:DNA-directed RNA polymerase III subunit RPC3
LDESDLTQRIFTLLLRRGRQSINTLAQQTHLPSRHIRHGLAVLIQQNLVYYHIEHDPETTYYEANQDASYFLLRSGKIIEYVHSRYGTPAHNIVQNLLFLGHAKICDLLEACNPKEQAKELHINGNGNGNAQSLANGFHNCSNESSECNVPNKLLDAMYQLLDSGLVAPVVKTMLQSPSDLYSQVEKEVLDSQYKHGIKGIKQKEEARTKIMERLRDIRTESEVWQRKGAKRPLNGVHMNGGGKRRKLANGIGAVDSESHTLYGESDRLDVGFSRFLGWP